jgi:hypothetical protein
MLQNLIKNARLSNTLVGQPLEPISLLNNYVDEDPDRDKMMTFGWSD